MVNFPTDKESHKKDLPDGRTIFDLITSNNLDAIRSLLTPLTLHDRLSIVYQKVAKKSLLYYACELGFKEIVKFLLDECGADIDDGCYADTYPKSPVHVAIRKLNIPLLALLMRRGATVDKNIHVTSCIEFAFKHSYNNLVSILNLYQTRANGISLSKARPKGKPYTGLFCFSGRRNGEYERRNRLFINAVTYGGTPTLKMLLTRGVNKNFQTDLVENPLCLAILGGQTNTVNFLINNKTYSLKSYASALELCGARYIVYLSEKLKALKCWLESIRVRQENCIGFLDKDQVRSRIDLGIEFQSEEEIEALRDDHKGLYLQALLVYLRLLSRPNDVTETAFKFAVQHDIFQEDLLLCLRILAELYYRNTDDSLVRYPTEHALETMKELFSFHFETSSDAKKGYLLKFGKLFDFLDTDRWGVLFRGSHILYETAYEELLEYVLLNISNMDSYDLSQEERKSIEKGVGLITGKCSYHYPTTLIHEAIGRRYPSTVVALLLNWSADPNCPTRLKNTPLHLVSTLYHKDTYLVQVLNLLIEAGAHVDSVNTFGTRPLEALQEKGIIKQPLKYLSLQCLAARAIYKFGIEVSEEKLPKGLVRFIRLHSA